HVPVTARAAGASTARVPRRRDPGHLQLRHAVRMVRRDSRLAGARGGAAHRRVGVRPGSVSGGQGLSARGRCGTGHGAGLPRHALGWPVRRVNVVDPEHEPARVGAPERESGPVRRPPRLLVRLFWSLHRGLLRLSGGRFGLSRPKLGKRFGMMRIDTVGRRSGQPRMVIVGYFEDGPNLVTLAMNGWADAPPAWWLNLEAHPETT